MSERKFFGHHDFRRLGGPLLTPQAIEHELDRIASGEAPAPWWHAYEFYLSTDIPAGENERFVSIPGLGALYPDDVWRLEALFTGDSSRSQAFSSARLSRDDQSVPPARVTPVESENPCLYILPPTGRRERARPSPTEPPGGGDT